MQTKNEKKIAFFTATSAEAALVRRRLRVEVKFFEQDVTIWFGVLEPDWSHSPILLVQTGIGPEAAERAAKLVFSKFEISEAWVLGFGGGTDSELLSGNPIVASSVKKEGEVPLVVSSSLLEKGLSGLQKVGQTPRSGLLETVSEVANLSSKKKRQQAGVSAIAMEGYPIAKVADQYKVPFVEIRWILDELDFDLPDWSRFLNSDGTVKVFRFLQNFVSNPGQIAIFLQFLQRFLTARRRMKDFIRGLVEL